MGLCQDGWLVCTIMNSQNNLSTSNFRALIASDSGNECKGQLLCHGPQNYDGFLLNPKSYNR